MFGSLVSIKNLFFQLEQANLEPILTILIICLTHSTHSFDSSIWFVRFTHLIHSFGFIYNFSNRTAWLLRVHNSMWFWLSCSTTEYSNLNSRLVIAHALLGRLMALLISWCPEFRFWILDFEPGPLDDPNRLPLPMIQRFLQTVWSQLNLSENSYNVATWKSSRF